MTKKNPPRGTRLDAASSEGKLHGDPLELLRRHVDAATSESAADAESELLISNWIDRVAQLGILRRAPLSAETLNVVAVLSPPASITAAQIDKLNRERRAVRDAVRADSALESECDAVSPADLLHALRAKAGVSAEQVAAIFGVAPKTWIAIESKQQSWYQLPSEALPAFAHAVNEPLERLVRLIALTARRALYNGIDLRVRSSLGRFDSTQEESNARRDTLRLAFARVQEENKGAARFLAGVRRASGIQSVTDAPNRRRSE